MATTLPPDPNRQQTWEEASPNMSKWLNVDGSVTDGANQILPPDPDRARAFSQASPNIAKWLQSDGSVASGIPGSGGGSGGVGPQGPPGPQGPAGPIIPNLLARRVLTEGVDFTTEVHENKQETFHPAGSHSVSFGGDEIFPSNGYWNSGGQENFVRQPLLDWIDTLRFHFSQIGVDTDVTLTPEIYQSQDGYAYFTLTHIASNGDAFYFNGSMTNYEDDDRIRFDLYIYYNQYIPFDPQIVNNGVIGATATWETDDYTYVRLLGMFVIFKFEKYVTATDDFDVQLAGVLWNTSDDVEVSPVTISLRATVGSYIIALMQYLSEDNADYWRSITIVHAVEDDGALVLNLDISPSYNPTWDSVILTDLQVLQVVRTGLAEVINSGI